MRDDLDRGMELGEVREEAPGVRVQRRGFLATAAGLFAAAGLGGLARAARVDPAREELDYDDFLREVIPVAKALVGDTSRAGQDRYLLALAAIAVRMADVPVPEMRSSGQGPGGTRIGANPGGDPFVVLHWRLDPGAQVRPHPHLYGNVLSLGLEGEVMVSNYELEGARDWDTAEPFRVRRTQHQRLAPREVNLVNLERNYVHGMLGGPAGGRGLDITTRIREKRPTPTLELGPEPLDPARQLWEARWAR